MKHWLINMLKNIAGQYFFYTAPPIIIFAFGILIAHFFPYYYTVPLTIIFAFIVGFLFIKYSKWY